MPTPPRSPAAPRPDPRTSTRQVLIIVLLAGILLVALGILAVLLIGLPGRLSPSLSSQSHQTPGGQGRVSPPVSPTISTAVPTVTPDQNRPAGGSTGAGQDTEGESPRVGHAPDFLPRSPIPEPGEVVTSAIPARRLDGGASTKPATAAEKREVVPWNTAARYVGKEITVEGKVVQTRRSGKVCFLNFSHDRDAFYLIMFEKTLKSWPEAPETYFKGKTIRAKGKVEMHDERPQIQIEDAAQIVVVE